MLHLTLLNTPEDRRRLPPALAEFGRAHALPARVLQAADLALEEHISNLLHHGYGPSGEPGRHQIHLRLAVADGWLRIEVEDDGIAFNPLARPPVDTSIHPDDKPIGGLGVHLIRSFMDTVDYQRDGNHNILRLGKRLTAPPTTSEPA